MPFHSLGRHRSLLQALKELGFARPTPIQSVSIPPALEGRDVLACASTGSGKTAAFMLPILNRLLSRPRGTTRALVLTPTRELAAQVSQHCADLAVHTPVTSAAIYGGVGMGPQEHAFRTGVDILVATPGRLLDHLRSSYAKLDKLEVLVLDEADRMLDMGFLPEIRRLLRQLPAKRQTLFFSATMPAPIVELSRGMLKDPVKIQIERASAPAVGITQAIYPVRQTMKSELLVALLDRGDIEEALVFTRTKHRSDRLARFLARKGIRAERIHGNRSQAQRTSALAGFKSGKYQVLVATDIAARGIDVEALGHVVNFDVPRSPDDYIHRVGRTGRAEATGDAFTFVAPDEEEDLRAIERKIGRRLPRVTVPDFDYDASPEPEPKIVSAGGRGGTGGGRSGFGGGRSAPAERSGTPRGRPSSNPGRPQRAPKAAAAPRSGHAPRAGGGDGGRARESDSSPSHGRRARKGPKRSR